MAKKYKVIVTLPPVKFEVEARNEEQVRERLLNNEYGYEIQEAVDESLSIALEEDDWHVSILEWKDGKKI